MFPALSLVLASMAAPVPPESEAQRIVRLWGEVLDPDKGSTISMPDRGKLRLLAGPGPRGINPAYQLNNAPRTLREVKGDFTATVRIVKDAPAEGVTRAGSNFLLAGGGGMLLWVSDEMHLRLGRSQWPSENGSQPKTTYSLRGVVNGDDMDVSQKTVNAFEFKPVTLKLKRAGNTLQASYSFDEKTWEKYEPLEAELPETVKLGVYAAHNFNKPLEVVFEPLNVAK